MGYTELIQTQNKLGHGVSYSQLEENNTALCLQKLATDSNQRVVLPASIKPHVFTNLAWDNIDRLEETLTGKGPSHRVNGIVVQANVYGPHLSRIGFIISTRDQGSISQGIVGCLPTIDSPATELNTVFQILKQSELIRK